MIDPPRLCDDQNPKIAALLRAGQSEIHPGRALEKTLAAVGAGGAVIGVSQSAAAAAAIGRVGFWSLAKWAGAGLVSGLVTVGGAHVLQQAPAPAEDPAPAAVNAGVEPRPVAPAARPARKEAAPVATFAEAPGQPAAPVRGRHPGATTSAHAVPAPVAGDSVTIEVLLIDEARRALAQGRARDALATLARYQAEAPARRLAPEARYLEMEAYLAAGETASARRAARTLVERYPAGPHTARAHWVLGDRTTGLEGLPNEEKK